MNASEGSSRGLRPLLRHRNFRFLWIGSTASTAGVYLGSLLFDWIISASSSTREAAVLLAILGIVEFVPSYTVGLLAGAWADRHDRRRLMLATQAGRAVAFVGLAVYLIRVGFDPVAVLGAALAISALGSAFGPAASAVLPDLVDKDLLTPANGLLQSAGTVAGFLSTPAGGVLVLLFGAGVGFLTDSLFYALSAAAISIIALPLGRRATAGGGEPSDRSTWADVRAGLGFLRSQPALLALVLVGTVLNFFSYYNIYIVLYTRDALHAGSAVFGFLLGAAAVGTALGALLTHRLKSDRAPGLWIPLLWGLSGAPLIVLILVPEVSVALGALAVQGFLASIVNVTLYAAVQRTVPKEFLGRFFATDSALSYAMIPVGLVAGATLIVAYGVGPAFLVAGGGMLVAGLSVLARRDVRGWGRHAAPPPPSRGPA